MSKSYDAPPPMVIDQAKREIVDGALDFGQRIEFPRQLRKPRKGGGVAARLSIHQVGQSFGELLFACFVHQAPVSWHSARKRFSARYTNSATASRDLPSRSAISAVERPSIFARISTRR